MSCKVGNLPVGAITYGSQNITKVIRGIVGGSEVLWDNRQTRGGSWTGMIHREDVWYSQCLGYQYWELYYSGERTLLIFFDGLWMLDWEDIQSGDGSEKTLVNEEMGINLEWHSWME